MAINAFLDAVGCGKRLRDDDADGNPAKRRRVAGITARGKWDETTAMGFDGALAYGVCEQVDIMSKTQFYSVSSMIKQLQTEQVQGTAKGTLRCHQLGQFIMWSNSKEQWFHLSRSDKVKDAEKRRQAAITAIKNGKLKRVAQRPSASPAAGNAIALAKWDAANAICFDQSSSSTDVDDFAKKHNILQMPKPCVSVAKLVQQLSNEHADGLDANGTLNAHIEGEVLSFNGSSRTWYLLYRSDVAKVARSQERQWKQEVADQRRREEAANYEPKPGEPICLVCGNYQGSPLGCDPEPCDYSLY